MGDGMLLRIVVVLGMLTAAIGGAVPAVAQEGDTGLTGYEELGNVSGTVDLRFPPSTAVFHQAKIAELPVSGTVNASWSDVELDADTTYRPQDVWGIVLGGERVLIRGDASVDVSGIEPGRYAVFAWGCSAASTVPRDCGWMRPRVFTVQPATACEAEGFVCTPPSVFRLAPEAEERPYTCSEDAVCVEFVDECDPRPAVSIVSPHPVVSGEPVEFIASASDCDGRIDSYAWDVRRLRESIYRPVGPSRAMGEERRLEHTFEETGRYRVDVVVEDDAGNTARARQVITVEEPPIPDWLVLSGHRGAGSDEGDSSLAPENTIMAFRTARAVGVDSVEFDIRRTADGTFVVIHDAWMGRTTPRDLPVAAVPADAVVGLRADADYTDIGTAYSVSEDAASEATVPSLAEALDYLERTDLLARIELKGAVRKDSDLGAAVYEAVASRDMVGRAVFMQWPGPCSNPLWGSRDCDWNGIEGVEDASGGEARTAALWRKRGGIEKDLHIDDTVREAEDRGFDIVVPRVDDPRAGGAYNNGLEGTSWSVDRFVEEVSSRGMDYAFMSFGGGLEEQLAYRPAWISGNRIDLLVERVRELDLDRYEGGYAPAEASGDPGGSEDQGTIPDRSP